MSEDRIFVDEKLGDEPFRFDDAVARVFPDMLRRSIPGYHATLEAIGSLAARFVAAGSRCYDLGCSLGGAALAMRQGIRDAGHEDCEIVAIDNAPAMVDRCREIIAEDSRRHGDTPAVTVELGDLQSADMRDASMVVLNYTLQFLPVAERDAVAAQIFSALRPGGLLVLSEKVVDEDAEMEPLLIDLYHEHKRRNDYSAMEIARKRAALENVLVPETVSQHKQRLKKAGFGKSAVWLRHFNFVSIIAFKPGDD